MEDCHSPERVAQVDHATAGLLYAATRLADSGQITLEDCTVGFDPACWPERDHRLRTWEGWEKLRGDGHRNC